MPQRSVVAVGASLLVASLALAGCGTRGDDSGSDRPDLAPAEQGRQDRRHRAPVRRPGRPRQGHPELGRPRHQAGERGQGHPRLDPRDRGRGRRGQARRRQERRDQARVRRRRRRCRRHAELQRRAERAAGPRLGQDHPGLPGQHRTRRSPRAPTSRPPRRAPTRPTSAPARPTRSRARSRRATSSRRPASRRSRRSTTRRPTARASSTRSPRSTPSSAARSSRPRRSTRTTTSTTPSSARSSRRTPKAVYYGGEYPQAGPFSQQMKAAGLNVPLMGGDGIYSGEYIKLAGATARGRPRHLGRCARPTPSASAKAVRRGLQGRRLRRAVRGLRCLLLRRGQRHHQRAQGLARQRGLGRGGPPGHHRRDGARSPSTASPARWRSTSSATPRPRS